MKMIEKIAIGPVAAAAGLGAVGAAGAYGLSKVLKSKKRKEKAFTKRLTGRYQPGAGMIAPPRAY
jgi:hypothetical protein